MTGRVDLEGLLGAPRGEVERRLGPPDATREAGGDTWMVYRRPGLGLRVRLSCRERAGAAGTDADGTSRGSGAGAGGGALRVRSWTATLDRGRSRLRDAVEPLGLWPAAAPDVGAGDVGAPMARRPLRKAGDDAVHSLTATVGGGGFVRVAAFDEPPDWL